MQPTPTSSTSSSRPLASSSRPASSRPQFVDIVCKFISNDSDFSSPNNILSNLTWKGDVVIMDHVIVEVEVLLNVVKERDGGYYKTTQYDYYLHL